MLVAIYATWIAWHPPMPPAPQAPIHIAIPDLQPLESGKWRIITHRMVWKKAVDDMKKRLLDSGFKTTLIEKREPVELHAFDDPRIVDSFKKAGKIKAGWEKKGIDADVLKYKDDDGKTMFKVGLGRFYLSEYAQRTERQIKKLKKPYNYARRTVVIPSYRFVFPAVSKNEAKILWKRLQNIGVGEPVMIQAAEFDKLYGALQ